MNLGEVAKQLEQFGYCVCPSFLESTLLSSACKDFEQIKKEGGFCRAGIGQNQNNQVQLQIRNDETFWFDRRSSNLTQGLLLDQIELLRNEFNQKLFLNLQDFEGHYASYEAGGFYRRHRDSFKNCNSRFVTVILYLNENWQEDKGGQLRIFHHDTYLDVVPNGGTMVCFMSQDLEHEVLTSAVKRNSFTGWLKVRTY